MDGHESSDPPGPDPTVPIAPIPRPPTPTPQSWLEVTPAPQYSQNPTGWPTPPPKQDRSRPLLIGLIATLGVLLVVAAVLVIVLIRGNSTSLESSETAITEAPGSSKPRSTTTSASSTTSSSATSSSTTLLPTSVPQVSPPPLPPTLPPTAPPTPPTPATSGPSSFRSPTGNIGCIVTVESARCDIGTKNWPPPARTEPCELDYGNAIEVTGFGADFICYGDTALGASEVLAYGRSSRAGYFVCESAQVGVTCRNELTGHGFFLARERYELF